MTSSFLVPGFLQCDLSLPQMPPAECETNLQQLFLPINEQSCVVCTHVRTSNLLMLIIKRPPSLKIILVLLTMTVLVSFLNQNSQ